MSTPPQGHSRPPLLADRYELGTTLGRGGMADVYRATDRLLNRTVAVKVLREAAGDESDRARFVAEARTVARLSHSGLVVILDAGFGRDGGTDRPFLVMELVDGRTLAQAIAAGPMPLEEVAAIGSKVAEALAHVHDHGIVHRDVKPGNVLLGQAGQVKLADFGIARLLGDSARHTRTGHTIGTAAYLSPEQVTGQDVTVASDVYSLGLVLLEALTGALEYPGPAMEAALARLNRPPRLPEDLPPPWQRLLADMTALDPAGRPSAAEVAAWLADRPTEPMPVPAEAPLHATQVLTAPSLAAAPAPPPPPPPAPAAPAEPSRPAAPTRRVVIGSIVALLLVLLVLAVAGIIGIGGDDGTEQTTDIPSDTPRELRAPLEELHQAVHGEDQ